VYAIFGIPMFLILLADFGKLFTRGIKFVWAFVRRVYYTGSCKKVRRTVPVQVSGLEPGLYALHINLCSYPTTFLVDQRSRVFEKLIVTQLVKKLPAFYGTTKFITTPHPHWSLS
jgi:hypothetical protein